MQITGVSLWTRVTHWANVLVWRTPFPVRVQALLSLWVYRNPPMPAARVTAVLDVLAANEIDAWVMGGWGIDALAGSQTRTHHDLDLIVDHADCERALARLRELGYIEWHRHSFPRPLGELIATGDNVVVRDSSLRVIDVHDIGVRESGYVFTTGVISGRPVRCLTAEQHLRTHQRAADTRRLRKLAGHDGTPPAPMTLSR